MNINRKFMKILGLLILIYFSYSGNYLNYFNNTTKVYLYGLIDLIVMLAIITIIPLLFVIIRKNKLEKRLGENLCGIISIIYFIMSAYLYINKQSNSINIIAIFAFYFINKILFVDDNKNNLNNTEINISIYIFMLLISSIIISIAITLYIFPILKKENKKNNFQEQENLNNITDTTVDDIQENTQINYQCNFTKSNNVKKVIVSAQSSLGVGDIFSKMDSDIKYRIYDNDIGDTYNVNYKMNGDPEIYECNESWYNVTLPDGTTGFLWGGYQDMYVDEK